MLRIFTDPRCSLHRAPPWFPERPERLAAVTARLAEGPWPIAEEASASGAGEAIAAVHDRRYVERLHAAVERGDGLIDSADNPLSAGTWNAARAAVEVALTAADWVMEGSGRAAFAALRPPGHHAERAFAMGFCYFNNAAVAAEHLIRHHGLDRVAILDFDVHHGNGSQHIFEERRDVLYVSTHQYPFYPGTGAASESGRGAGQGATLNVPLPAGTGDRGYRQAFAERMLPALRRHAPQALVISAGFDAWRRDPVGGMAVTEDGFEEWGRLLGELAHEVAGGRSISFLEGGYDLEMLGELASRYLRGLDPAETAG
jgi:acetoin utilization deacetylase AcuC-like enzyme